MKKSDWELLKIDLEASDEVLVGADLLPYGQPYVLIIGSSKTNLDMDTMSYQLEKFVGIPNVPLSKGKDNFYPFVVLLHQGEPNLLNENTGQLEHVPVMIDAIEDWVDNADAAFVLNKPIEGMNPELLEDLDAAAVAHFTPSTDPENPIIIGTNAPLDPNAWINMRVFFNGSQVLNTESIKQLLEGKGFKVLAPDRGLPGLFISSTSVATENSAGVFFNPGGHAVTGAELQAEVFDQYGYTGVTPLVSVGLYTSERTQNNQQMLSFAYQAQQSTDDVSDFLEALLEILGKLLKALPVIFWIAVGGVSLFVGWQLVKYIREERKRKSVISRRLKGR